MGSVGTPVVRRMVEVARGPESGPELLATVGVSSDPETAGWAGEAVAEDAYYGLIERIVGTGDDEFPLRYGDAVRPDDFGLLGLVLKTAPTIRDAISRLVRYILVLSDTLEYELREESWGGILALNGRPHHRRGAALANECALAAFTSLLRQSAGTRFPAREVRFRHPPPPTGRHHEAFFGCAVRFGMPTDAVHLDGVVLDRPTLLADDGLSAYLLAQLDELKAQTAQRTIVDEVRGAVADALPDGQPSKSQIARRLGMSERTLHRHLADHGESFQAIATGVRRDAAANLLRAAGYTLADVAFLTGFSDQTSFTRAFKRWTGVTPAAYRAEG